MNYKELKGKERMKEQKQQSNYKILNKTIKNMHSFTQNILKKELCLKKTK